MSSPRPTRDLLLLAALVSTMILSAGCAGKEPGKMEAGKTEGAATELQPPPMPVLSPTALTADGGDGRAYLRWNLQVEDERVVGWRVLQTEPAAAELTPQTLTEPVFVARGLANGQRYAFVVVGVLKDGSRTPPSNSVSVQPHPTGDAKITLLKPATQIRATPQSAATTKPGDTLSFGPFKDVLLTREPVKVVFPDGQELVYDDFRPVDWKTVGGEHLIYPGQFGNGLDVGKFDSRGLALIIPPDGLDKDRTAPAIDQGHAPNDALNREYRDVQYGHKHPWITDPMTAALDNGFSNDARPRWFPPTVDGDRVTFHYWQPLVVMGYRSWNYVMVWETWWPIQRDRHGCVYHGLARLVEVEMLSSINRGYQIMLNNGLGPGGSRQGVVYYGTGFSDPGHEVVDFSGDRNQQVMFQSPKPPRRGYGYHPNHDCLQSSPLIFYDWGTGSLTVTARSLYYHCANSSSSYVEQGADGVWPNLAWDMARAGQRTAVDTVEYLHTSDMAQPLPQRFINARFEVYGDVSRRMGVQDTLGAVAMYAPHSEIEAAGGPRPFAAKKIKKYEGTGIDVLAMYHDIWHAVPITVDDAYRFDPNHDCNPSLKAMCDDLQAGGLHPGFWFRPEFTKTSVPAALSKTIPTADAYYGYSMCKYPNAVALLNARGIPLFREHTDWVRRGADGAWPFNTPYQWTPMSLATGWFDRIVWPTLWMSGKLGFQRVLVNGGFGGLQGVDYAPMLQGRREGTVPCQPYWWRMWRCMKVAGIKMFGECTVGWKGGNVTIGGPGDEYYQWMLQMGWYNANHNKPLMAPALAHRTFQLYNSNRGDAGNAPVRRYARRFYETHRAPDWIELTDLRQTDPVEITVTLQEGPATGLQPTEAQKPKTVTVRPWTWTDAVWHYDDGTSVVYPAYDKIDWTKE